jgi:transposase
MRKNILSFSYSELHAKLIYKAMRIGRLVVKVDSRYTSQECSGCKKKLKLSDSENCGLEIGRVQNATKPLERKGIKYINSSHRSKKAKSKSNQT